MLTCEKCNENKPNVAVSTMVALVIWLIIFIIIVIVFIILFLSLDSEIYSPP